MSKLSEILNKDNRGDLTGAGQSWVVTLVKLWAWEQQCLWGQMRLGALQGLALGERVGRERKKTTRGSKETA